MYYNFSFEVCSFIKLILYVKTCKQIIKIIIKIIIIILIII